MTEKTDQKLRESLIRIESAIAQLQKDVAEIKLDQKSNYVGRDEFTYCRKDVDEIQDNIKWLMRLVVGAIVTAIMGLIIVVK